MRYLIGLLIFSIIAVGCTEPKEKSFLKERMVSLASPRVHSTNTIIDSIVIVSADFRLKGAQIFYTTDGSIPTRTSNKYNKPFSTNKEGLYQFKVFHSKWKPSEITELKLYKKGITPHKINWHTNASDSYKGMGTTTVINQRKASLNFRDTEWVGFDTIAKASISFEKSSYIESISVGYLINQKSWIFPPERITIYLNNIDTIEVNIPKSEETTLRKLEDVKININKEVKTLTISVSNLTQLPEWHPGKGNKAWLFMDEWIFHEKK
ncbi:MAG: chitobiase/beta-hexosaminidase C-terminal domain-containing protein [Flavobacteriaceae bacterium]